jgi:hypothetical protein
LPIGWAGRLASALAAQGVTVLGGRAHDRGAARWEAQFDVDLVDASLPLDPQAVAAMLRPDGRAPRPVGGLTLRAHRVFAAGEDLLVEIDAADSQGFLDRILRVFAFHGLFPRQMTIETIDGRIHDSFRLRGVHDGGPEQATVRALDARLRGMRSGLRPDGVARSVRQAP